jgi:phosphotransferase system IIB component
MKKFKWILLNILTLGILYFYAKHKAKGISTNVNSNLVYSTKVNFNINELVDNLGGIDNITDSSSTLSSLKVSVKDTNIVDKSKFIKLGAKGAMVNSNQVIILFGDNSIAIDNQLKQKIHD